MAIRILTPFFSFAGTNDFTFWREPGGQYKFDGWVRDRLQANVDHWLIPAPVSNPGLISMFEVRDRKPAPNLVPWAGEFAGKYLISAVQAMRMEPGAKVAATAESVVQQLIATQADDGYLGPFRKEERLRGHWDLWGHYHCMLGLLMWHEESGSTNALHAARKIGDLVCDIYLDTGKRAFDAGSDEMNLAIIHSLGWLYRITREERYLRMMHEIEKDWERGGDYLRAGLNRTEFFQTKRPRWESLHNIQGLVGLYRITGDQKYREAFEHHWRSIARWDLRNTGGFSSGEQATGNPYSPTPIETCCTIAWMAMSVDMLALNGDSKVADLLELATFNAWAGAQHPSGRWCTYNTPMDGVREASAHTIVFQSRHGTPELNCCSVNGPRGWGMLSEWAFMKAEDGYVLNWLAPGSAVFTERITNETTATITTNRGEPRAFLAAQDRYGRPITVEQRERIFWIAGNYPVDGNVEIRPQLNYEEELTLRIRIPEWSTNTRVWLNDQELRAPQPGRYFTLRRKWQSHWKKEDVVRLAFDMTPRVAPGAREAAGKISLYRGPILLAADQRFNSFDEAPAIDAREIGSMRLEQPMNTNDQALLAFNPLLLMQTKAANGEVVRLCDFASAGATGSRYQSWLTATNAPPAPVVTRLPKDSATVATGKILFRWTRAASNELQFLQFSTQSDFRNGPEFTIPVTGRAALVSIHSDFARYQWWHWRVMSSNQFGLTPSSGPHARFRVDPALQELHEQLPQPRIGSIAALTDPISFNGIEKRIFEIGEWPEENYSVTLRFRLRTLPTNRLGQIFSAWAAPMDDPLRITIENGKISARLETGAVYSTQSVPIEAGRWYEVTAAKHGSKLALILDGTERGSCTVPHHAATAAKDFALGGNPHFPGNEHIDGEIDRMEMRTE